MRGRARDKGGGGGMRRKLFTLAAGVSAVLGIATIAAWAWGQPLPLRYTDGGGASCDHGSIYFSTMRYVGRTPGVGPWLSVLRDEWRVHWTGAGFEFGRGEFIDVTLRYETTLVGIPLWCVSGITAALPASEVCARARRRRDSRRAARG